LGFVFATHNCKTHSQKGIRSKPFQTTLATHNSKIQSQHTIAKHIRKTQSQPTIASNTSKTQLCKHYYKKGLRSTSCKTRVAKHNCKTTHAKQQFAKQQLKHTVLTQMLETLRGSPPTGGATAKHSENALDVKLAAELFQKPLRTPIGYAYHWEK